MQSRLWLPIIAVVALAMCVPAVAEETNVLQALSSTHRDCKLVGHFYVPTWLAAEKAYNYKDVKDYGEGYSKNKWYLDSPPDAIGDFGL